MFDLTNYSAKSKLLQKLTNDNFCDKPVSDCLTEELSFMTLNSDANLE